MVVFDRIFFTGPRSILLDIGIHTGNWQINFGPLSNIQTLQDTFLEKENLYIAANLEDQVGNIIPPLVILGLHNLLCEPSKNPNVTNLKQISHKIIPFVTESVPHQVVSEMSIFCLSLGYFQCHTNHVFVLLS